MLNSRVKTNIAIRFAFPEKIKSSLSCLAHCRCAGLLVHWSGTGGLWKKGKDYGGCLTLGGGVQAAAGSSLYTCEGLCSASGAGEGRGDGCAPCRNPKQHPAFIRALLGCLCQAALCLSPESESSVQSSWGILSLHDLILFCVVSVQSLSQEYCSWVRSPSKPCLRWPTFPLTGKGTVCVHVSNWPGMKEALIFDLRNHSTCSLASLRIMEWLK